MYWNDKIGDCICGEQARQATSFETSVCCAHGDREQKYCLKQLEEKGASVTMCNTVGKCGDQG